jgi:phosphatidylserine/phosphatidylglycerophosphate/cardiolipin synthase-like enzyme
MTGRIQRVAVTFMCLVGLVVTVAGCRFDLGDGFPERHPLPPGNGLIRGPYAAQPGPTFAAPADPPIDNRAVRALVENIRHTPRGATIRIVAYSFALEEVSGPLIAADQRGVHVQVVVDGRHSHAFDATQVLVSALGTDRHRPSFIVLTHGSARGMFSHSHQKSWSFSRTGSSRHVVMVGATNLSELGATQQYSDMYTFVGRPDVWRAFSTIFRAQARDTPVPDPAVTDHLGPDTAYFFPGFSMADDPIADMIARLPADPSTHIRIVMYAWHPPRGQRIVDLLLDKLRGGATVQIVRGPYVRQPLGALVSAGAKVFRGVFANGDHVHDKLMVVEERRDGHEERFVTTGSDNWGMISFLRDDVDMKIAVDAGEYGSYVAFFDRLVQRGREESRHR